MKAISHLTWNSLALPEMPREESQEHEADLLQTVSWFWTCAAVALLAVYAGWSAARYGFTWSGALAAAFALLALLPLAASASWPRMARTAGALLCAVAFGMVAANGNVLRINEWMESSMAMLQSSIDPVDTYALGEAPLVLSPERRKALEEEFAALTLSGNRSVRKALVSFESSLVTIEGTKVQFHTGSGVMLAASTLLPDGSFFYYDYVDPKTPEWSETGSNGQALNRAVIRDGVVHRLWTRRTSGLNIHHWGDVFDGKLYMPGKQFADLPNAVSAQIGGRYGQCKMQDGIREMVYVFDVETGEMVREIDVLPLVAALAGTEDSPLKNITECNDPLHLNDVHVIGTARHAGYFPDGKVGDILVSLREMNTIALIDKDTLAVKWHVSNAFRRQHAPRVTDHGTVVLFDNLGSDAKNGRSRVTEIDIATRKTVGTWEAGEGDFFESNIRGKVTILAEGKLLIQGQSVQHAVPPSMFVLECPQPIVSMACKKSMVFEGGPKTFGYDNAAAL